MNDQPPPLPPAWPPTAPETPAVPHGGSPFAGWIAALVIALSVALAMGRVAMDKAAMAGEQAADGANGATRLQEELGARYLVGMNSLLGPMMAASGESKEAWLAPFEAAAKTPRQRMELDILRRELAGDAGPGDWTTTVEPATEAERRDWEALRALQRPAGPGGAGGSLSEEERSRFEQRFGWFARLALSRGLPEDDPARAAVLGAARRTFVGSILLAVGAGAALVLGCGLAVWAVARFASGRGVWWFAVRDRAVVAATGGSIWLETFAVYLGIMVLGGLLADFLPPGWAPWPQAAAFAGAAGLGACWPWLRGMPRAARSAGFGWTRGRGVLREIAAGLLGYCAGLPIVAAGVGLTMVLTFFTKADASHPLNHLTGVSPPALVFLGFLAAVWAPVVEETFFRGAFYAAWRQACGRWLSGLATGILFAAVHPQGWTAIPALGAVGLVMALLREWRGSLIAPVTAHALNNGTLFAMMIVVMR